MRFPKPKCYQNPDYLDWLKKQSCSLMLPGCFYGGDAHHTKTKGSGAHDNYAIPVCRICHTLIQNATRDQMATWGTSKEELYRIAIESFAEYLMEVDFHVVRLYDHDKAERILWNFGLEEKQGAYSKIEIAEAILKAYASGKRDAPQPTNAKEVSWKKCRGKMDRS